MPPENPNPVKNNLSPLWSPAPGTYPDGKVVILSAPSGAGKTTIVHRVMALFPGLEFSISATSRSPRHTEKHGVDYYFVTGEEFTEAAAQGKFVEWEEVYAGTHYGTLVSEVERIWQAGKAIIFDVDVKGGISLKSIFGDRALSLFIMPPSVEELRRRLTTRGTDAPDVIERRVAKAETEIADAGSFDRIVVNEDLETAVDEVADTIRAFLGCNNPKI